MRVVDELLDQGIRLRDYSVGTRKTVCPRCHGGRTKEHCLSVTIDANGAVWKCHRATCGWTGAARERQERAPRYIPRPDGKPTPKRPTYRPDDASLTDAALKWFAGRGMTEPTLTRNRITVTKTWMPGTDGEVSCIAFPYYRNRDLVNVKYRDGQKRFRQEKDAEKVLFGIDDIGPDTREIVLVEGEMDKLACNEVGLWNVVSVPDGAPASVRDDVPGTHDDTKFSYLWTCRDVLDRADKVVLAVDADGPGQALEEELARRLGKHRCWRVTWPALNDSPCKDANDVLLHHGAQVLRECIERAQPYPIQSLFDARQFETEALRLLTEGHRRGLSTGWPELDEFYTVRPGELTVITGYPGSGKSEFVDALTANLARDHGFRTALCSFENPPAEHLLKLAQKRLGLPYTDGPTTRMTEVDLGRAMAWIEVHFAFIRADDEAPTLDWLLDAAHGAVMRHGVQGLVIDPYNELEHRRPAGMTETEYVSQLLGRVKRFAANHDIHVWFIAHPAKPQRVEGKYPIPSLYDISGGAHWHNKADVGIVVYRPWDDEATPSHLVDVFVKKVRFGAVGRPGKVRLEYNPITGRYGEGIAA